MYEEDILTMIVRGDFEGFLSYVENDNNLSRFNIKKLNVLHQCAISARKFNPKILNYILEFGGLDINSKTNEGWTSLYCAIESNNVEALKVLLKAGANPNTKSDDGHTALTLAMQKTCSEIVSVKLLLEYGADPDVAGPEHEFVKGTFREEVLSTCEEFSGEVDEDDLYFKVVFDDLKPIIDAIPFGSRESISNEKLEIKESVLPENWTYNDIADEFVPRSGLADSKQGELARVIGRLIHEHNNNGNINWDDSFIQLTDWFEINLSDESVFDETELSQIKQDIKQIKINGESGRLAKVGEVNEYTRLMDLVVIWCKRNPKKMPCESGLPF
ncbi:MAG: ankyrin repeat domain-containing protein [Saccharospirillaceae bacterium]|nr:ankyrin repeat domain-containing protein [Pseudomonadales bacterium]NRB81063.1 ankyrin repeat domain-containing protein [Saccharospirillaceae bacterium]